METTATLLTRLTLDFEEFSEAIEGANGEMRLTARDEAPWLQDLLSIDGIVVQVMQEGGGEYVRGRNRRRVRHRGLWTASARSGVHRGHGTRTGQIGAHSTRRGRDVHQHQRQSMVLY
jgi:hypothetical protein